MGNPGSYSGGLFCEEVRKMEAEARSIVERGADCRSQSLDDPTERAARQEVAMGGSAGSTSTELLGEPVVKGERPHRVDPRREARRRTRETGERDACQATTRGHIVGTRAALSGRNGRARPCSREWTLRRPPVAPVAARVAAALEGFPQGVEGVAFAYSKG